jgi:hypothetical protein
MPQPDDANVDPRSLAELLRIGKTTSWSDNADERPEAPDPETADGRRLGEYQLLEKLGEGGMGVVYRARHTELDRLVAVKVLASGRLGDEEAVARFRREIRAAGKLDHPNIVRAHDARQIGAAHLLVMEYVDGVDLGTLVRRTGPLRVADACELVRQAALGLGCAHAHGLVHRDIKPSNLMLGREGTLKILDLGLARVQAATASAEMTVVGQVMGTPDYMAPEQASDSHSVDGRADLYSLGCTLYELLAGRPPFSGPSYGTLMEKLAGHARDPVPPIQQLRDDVPKPLAAALERLLSKDPAERFQTPDELAKAIAPFADGSDLPALATGGGGPPAGAAETISAAGATTLSVARRRRWIAIVVGVVVVLIAVLAVRRAREKWDEIAEPSSEPAQALPADPAAAELPGWIVMSWAPDAGRKPNLWLVRPDGTRRTPLTDDPSGMDVHPAFSPDGRQVAFVRASSMEGASSIWVCDADGTGARQLVRAAQGERLISPVWIGPRRIVYTRDPALNRLPDMQLWQVDLATGQRTRLLAVGEALPGSGGLATSASPDGRHLALVAQRAGLWPTADIYTVDLDTLSVAPVWEDVPDQYKDARPLWSPDGRSIAWHRNLTPGGMADVIHYGVARARMEDEGGWRVELPGAKDGFLTPLAFAPAGNRLLCARLTSDGSLVTLVLLDEQCRVVRELFELRIAGWQPERRDFARLADWAVVPEDVRLPEDGAPD